MARERSKNTIRNIIFGFVYRAIVMIIPFIIRTIIIYKLGVEYVGINSLFVSILQVLSVAELGFAAAINFALYGPVAKNDTEKVRELVALLRSIYLIVGVVITVAGLIVTPFIGFLVKGDVPADINLYLLYLIYLSNTVITYFVYGYKNSILNVYQRNDVISKISSVVEITRGLIQVGVLLLTKNYYIYIAMLPVFTLVSSLVTGYITNRMHPELNVKMKFSFKGIGAIKKQLGGIAIGRISLVCRNSFDSIIISAVLGLTMTAIYSNYYLIFSSVTGFLTIFLTSMGASVGNSLVTESIEKNERDHRKFDFYYMFIIGFCTICMFGLYQPFMEIWVGKDLMFGYFTMILFCIYFYSNGLAQVRSVYSEAAGLWWHFRYFSIGEMVANLLLNIGLGIWWGVDGIIFATIITSFVCSFVSISIITYNKLFKCSAKKYFLLNAMYMLIVASICVGVHFVLKYIPLEGWAKFGVAIPVSIGGGVVLFLAYLMIKETRTYISEATNIIRRR